MNTTYTGVAMKKLYEPMVNNKIFQNNFLTDFLVLSIRIDTSITNLYYFFIHPSFTTLVYLHLLCQAEY